MFVRSTKLDLFLSALFIVAMGCGNIGGCGACGQVQELPGGKLPSEQTIEGGAQIRVTAAGFNKLTQLVPALINQQLGGGVCVPRGTVGGTGSTSVGAEYCHLNQTGCPAANCRLNLGLNPNGVSMQVVGNAIRVGVSANFQTTLPIHGWARVLGVGFNGSCTLNINSPNIGGSFDIGLGIRGDNGELQLTVSQINSLNLNLNINGCGILGDIADVAADLIQSISNSFLGQFAFTILQPVINDLVQGLLPSPLGIAGLMDVGNLLSGVSPGTEALMEARIVPGGYARIDQQLRGLSLGVITGMNADEDITTRDGLRADNIPNASEPNLCVPPMAPPLFGSAPHNLAHPPDNAARGTYFLPPAGAFNGSPEPAADLAMGLSETFLDLAGHHLVTSGAMCLGVGTSYITQLNVGTIGILVPSLSELTSDTGKDPLLLVTRPQKPVNFTIGDNTVASPALTLGIQNLEVDFYAFLYERYVRAFTLDLSMNVGVNLEFEQMGTMPAVIKPSLVGISSTSVTVKVLNSDFVRETPQHLEMVLPSVFDLVTPLLGNIGAINVPSFAGFSLNNLSIQHVVTPQDDFLALFATLGAGTLMRQLGDQGNPFAIASIESFDREIGPAPAPVTVRPTLRDVKTPAPAEIRTAMTKGGASMPTVTFEAPRFDDRGRELEYSYNLNGGMQRPFVSPDVGNTLTVRDPAFAWQGKYTIGFKSRVKGNYRTTSAETTTPVIIDSEAPRIAIAKKFWDEDTLKIPMFDTVSEHNLTYAFGRVGEEAPTTEWVRGTTAEITKTQFDDIAIDGKVLVYAKDEVGNVEYGVIEFHGQASGEGCGCETSSGPSSGGIVLVLFVGIVMFGRGRGRRALVILRRAAKHHRLISNVVAFVTLSAITAFLPACDCGDPGAKSCEVASDCGPDFCEAGQLPFCIDGECLCSDDIIAGRVGPYSDVGTGADGSIWVSAYSQNHGDLVVAKADGPGRIPVEKWEYVDGVPDGPILIPDSKIRGGIDAAGEDVGMYTSIAVNNAGEPMVTYFDRDTSSLRFAQKVGGVWQKHTIEAGTGPMLGEQSGLLVGMYTSLTLRTDDGRPGVAYLAHVKDGQGTRAEVRYAAAQTATPTSASDWQLWIVDQAPLPPEDPEHPEVYPLPNSLGLFVDSARLPNQAPVVVYYDRVNGDLKISKFNPGSGQFGVATLLDGAMNVDAGWSPSISVDTAGVVHVAYVSSTRDDLKYLTEGVTPIETVDDGYRIVGTTVDGLPKPEFHFVGDDASLSMVGGTTPWIFYQDATTQELLLSTKNQNGGWDRVSIAGAADPWTGAYGFFASTSQRATDIVISTWVINQPADNPFEDNWVEIFVRPTTIQ